jgi:hypothetical protein
LKRSLEVSDAPFTFGEKNTLAFRFYPDNRPRNLEIASLQKGLILLFRGEELIEEGAGFGVPIVKCRDSTYFSSTAELHVTHETQSNAIVKKIFFLDTISKKQVQSALINDNLYSVFHKIFEIGYLTRQGMRPVFDWMMRVRKTFGVNTKFTKTSSRGKVAVTYNCHSNFVKIEVDLSSLDKKLCKEILFLNEQGAANFRKYADTNGNTLYDRQIGAWTKVTAEKASFFDIERHISFTLENVEGAELYRGREQVRDRFSWAGMAYALSPGKSSFSYSVRIEEF